MYSVRKGVLRNFAKFTGITKQQFDQVNYVFKIRFIRRDKSSIVDVQLCSKYLTFHLPFLEVYRKFIANEIF